MERNEYCLIAGIPCLRVTPLDKPVGTVFLYHGWASNIEKYLFFATLLSDWGYQVVVPELPYHGERGTLNYFDTVELQRYFWLVVLQAVTEVEAITSELCGTEHKIGIMGHSTGGFIAAGGFAKVSGVQAAIVINGSCAWVKCEELFRDKDGRIPMNTSERVLLEEHDPAMHIDFSGNKALLLLHGKADNTIPIESQHYFMNAMSSCPISSDYLQFVEYPEVNHHVTLGMLQKSKEWLDTHLIN